MTDRTRFLATTALAGLIALSLAACSPSPEETAEAVATDQADLDLLGFMDEIFDREVDQSPDYQAYLGLKTDAQGEWSDTSDAYAVEEIEEEKADLERLAATFDIATLGATDRESYDLFVSTTEQGIRNAEFRRHFYVVDQFNGQYTYPLTLLQNNHPIASEQDARDYISRINGIEDLMAEMTRQVRDRADFGVVPPAFAFPAMITDLGSIASGVPIDASGADNPLYADFKKKVAGLKIPEAEKTALIDEAASAIRGPFQRGYAGLLAELKRLAPLQETNDGVWALPDGKAFYENRIRSHTTLDLTAAEIHRIGLDDVARIHEEMKAIMAMVGFDGSLADFFAFVRSDPNNFYEDSDAGRDQFLADAEAQTEAIFAVADQYFHTLPKAALEVRRVEPWRENSTSIAFYNSPSLDGARPGVYYANLADMTGVQKYVFTAITYHEGVPGHHFQLALSQELVGLPKFRKFGGQNAFVEGWALYAERLAREMGFYKDPMHDFGRLQDEIWRSVRLVTDTGIHAMKWTRQQAIDYFRANTPISEQDIVTEVERYFVNPGQALGYKMGMIKILALRDTAQRELGDKYDIRDFHDAVIGAGSLPLPLLERRVNAYIATRKSQP